jgi:hypothetical protein
MTFLQPLILWGLPLLLVPVIIHLLNRLRHRPQPWGAMMFLVSASRTSTSHARLRQLLVLLFRVLAVLALVLCLARPLAGGWLGWAVGAAPDVVLVLLDRSASMQSLDASGVSKLARALALIEAAARPFEATSELVLLDSATRVPQRLTTASALSKSPFAAPTDTTADLPAMFQAAIQWMIENQAGTTELWLTSDLQSGDWLPNDGRWKAVRDGLTALPQKVRVRLLAVPSAPSPNLSVALKEAVRRDESGAQTLALALDVGRSGSAAATVPLTLRLDGVPLTHPLAIEADHVRWRHRLALGTKPEGGWGSVEVPADNEPQDNRTFFAYGARHEARISVVASDAASQRIFRLAATAVAASPQAVESLSAAEAENAAWEHTAVVIWQGALPAAAAERRLRPFLETGGLLLCFPPGRQTSQTLFGIGWGEVEQAAAGASFQVARWEDQEGVVANTDEGYRLPLDEMALGQRQRILGDATPVAAFDDGVAFLARRAVGRGQVLWCATLPQREWSSLEDGAVLVPMLRRSLDLGTARLHGVLTLTCGELSAADRALRWEPADPGAGIGYDPMLHAGVYRAGARWLAVNRPAQEDGGAFLATSDVAALLRGLPFRGLEERGRGADALQGELWRLFLLALFACLIVESALTLPAGGLRSPRQAPASPLGVPANYGGA